MRIPRIVRDLQVERESLFLDFSSQRLFHGLDLFFGQRRQELSFRAVMTDAMSRDHEGQCLIQVLVDDHLRSSQGGTPLGALELHNHVVKAHRVIPIDGALVALCMLFSARKMRNSRVVVHPDITQFWDYFRVGGYPLETQILIRSKPGRTKTFLLTSWAWLVSGTAVVSFANICEAPHHRHEAPHTNQP